MAKGGNNKAGKMLENYTNLINYLTVLLGGGLYKEYNYSNDRIIVIKDNKGEEVNIGLDSGKYYDRAGERFKYSKAGDGKKNGRSYLKFSIPGNEKFMLANYVLMVILGELSSDEHVKEKSRIFKDGILSGETVEINHANGNVKDNRYINLDVTSKSNNLAHARLMSEFEYSMPGVYTNKLDNGSNIFIGDNRVYGKDIERFNRKVPRIKIKAYKDAKGEFVPRFSMVELNIIANKLGLSN